MLLHLTILLKNQDNKPKATTKTPQIIENEILEYINLMNTPISLDNIVAKLEDCPAYKLEFAITNLKKKGKIKEPINNLYILVRDFEEMQNLMKAEQEQEEKEYKEYIEKIGDCSIAHRWKEMYSVHNMHTFSRIRNLINNIIVFLDINGNLYAKSKVKYLTKNKEIIEFIEKHKDVKKIRTGYSTISILNKDGTLDSAVFENSKKEYVVIKSEVFNDKWNDIIDIEVGGGCEETDFKDFILGLKKNGTVVATGCNDSGQCNVTEWTNIVKIALGFNYSIGLKADGTVVTTGYSDQGRNDVLEWHDIVDIKSGGNYTVGLCKDGTVKICGPYNEEQNAVVKWTDISRIFASPENIFGIKSDGTIVCTRKEFRDLGIEKLKGIIDVVVNKNLAYTLNVYGQVKAFFIDKENPQKEEIEITLSKWIGVVSIMGVSVKELLGTA